MTRLANLLSTFTAFGAQSAEVEEFIPLTEAEAAMIRGGMPPFDPAQEENSGDEGDEGDEGNEDDEGDEGNEANEGNEPFLFDEGNEGNEIAPPADGT
ncbi:MAG: hypothetical protein KDK29_20765, partial [Sedimentitalea sp.]|nr:hypothetical protein [Sedimentitalea sp.]